MSFQMKNRYETGEEFYQDIKEHLIEDGFIVAKTDETIAIISNDEDEWYCHYQTCNVCGTDFMCSNAKFCPGCGRKIIGSKRGNETVFYGKGDEDESNSNDN